MEYVSVSSLKNEYFPYALVMGRCVDASDLQFLCIVMRDVICMNAQNEACPQPPYHDVRAWPSAKLTDLSTPHDLQVECQS